MVETNITPAQVFANLLTPLLAVGKDSNYDCQKVEVEAKKALEIANELELMLLDQATTEHYSVHLMLHFLSLDLLNAKYLWKRIPEKFKAKGAVSAEPLNDIWSIGKSLTKREFSHVFKLISDGVGTKGQPETVKKLVFFQKKLLREQMFGKIARSFISIDFSKAKTLLGYDQDDQAKKDLAAKGFVIEGKFVKLSEESQKALQALDQHEFELNKERMDRLVDVVAFLEQAKLNDAFVDQADK